MLVNFLQPEIPYVFRLKEIYQLLICRRVSLGPMGYGMLGILALTYLFIKIRTPKLPAHHKGLGLIKVTGMGAVGWMVAYIVYTPFMVNGRHTKMEELLIGYFICHTFGNLLTPLYYIYSTPKLCQYVKGFFVKPFICRTNQVTNHANTNAVVI